MVGWDQTRTITPGHTSIASADYENQRKVESARARQIEIGNGIRTAGSVKSTVSEGIERDGALAVVRGHALLYLGRLLLVYHNRYLHVHVHARRCVHPHRTPAHLQPGHEPGYLKQGKELLEAVEDVYRRLTEILKQRAVQRYNGVSTVSGRTALCPQRHQKQDRHEGGSTVPSSSAMGPRVARRANPLTASFTRLRNVTRATQNIRAAKPRAALSVTQSKAAATGAGRDSSAR
ncbi:hypothetical protein B0H12DRAFT_1220415 [Mycena haematopus]|nr:hypothetical protein B0H12DRAFT_1220415 [Mycena haematopus]